MKLDKKILKEFAQYILTEYQKLNENANSSRLGIELSQFIHKGRIEDVVDGNAPLNEKQLVLGYLKMSVENYARDWDKTTNIQNFTVFSRKNRIEDLLKDGIL
jgi:hypothetical protein